MRVHRVPEHNNKFLCILGELSSSESEFRTKDMAFLELNLHNVSGVMGEYLMSYWSGIRFQIQTEVVQST